LRAAYPGVEISCIPHGRAALELRARFEMDALPDVDRMTGESDTAIFTDRKGHAGQILKDLGTSVWLGAIYGVEVTDVLFTRDYETDLAEIAETILGDDPYAR